MPESVSKADIDYVMARLGYRIIGEQDDIAAYWDEHYPPADGHYLLIVFEDGRINYDNLRRILEYEGVNIAVFNAEMEA